MPHIKCDCGQMCTKLGVRVVAYTMWQRWDGSVMRNTYVRTCGFCYTPAKRAQLEADGYSEFKHFAKS